jgi:hypothetical protein
MAALQIPDNDAKLQEYNNLRSEMISNPQKYDFDSTKLHALKPRYNDKNDGLERDNQMYLEEENNLFHATIITMTTLLIASIVIASSR